MSLDLVLRGVFDACAQDGPLEFHPRAERVADLLPLTLPCDRGEHPPEVLAAASLLAVCGGHTQIVMGLLDGRGGLWLLHNRAMSFLLKACLDRVAEETGREPGGEPMLLIVGLSGALPPDQAEVLERLSVRVACAAAGARHPLRFMTAFQCDDDLILHTLHEEEVAAILCGPAPDRSVFRTDDEGA